MVGSRNDTKRRRKHESPQDTQPKRTKVHAQRKFAQGAGGGLTLTPMKDKEKPRSNALSTFTNNGANSNGSTNWPTTGTALSSTGIANTTSGSSATAEVVSTPSCKRPSTEDFLTFLCFHRTNMLPNRLQFFSSAPQQELDDEGHPAQDSVRGSRSTERNREQTASGGNRRSPIKASLATHKAVTAAQALKKKYQDQRLKKTVASTLIQKGTQRMRTTRSGAIVPAVKGPFLAKTTPSKKETALAVNKKKASISSKNESAPKKSVKTPTSGRSQPSTPNSSTRGGLRSGGPQKLLSLRTQKSPQRKTLAKAVQSKVAKVVGKGPAPTSTPLKPMASSMSDFSSEDDQPLVKKNKPLMQARKLLKKSIASIGRKLMLEPRRSRRGVPLPTASPATRQKTAVSVPTRRFRGPLRGISLKPKDTQGNDDGVTESSSETPRKKDVKVQSGKDDITSKGKPKLDAKEMRDSSPDSKRKSKPNEKSGKRPPLPKMKKGYVLELVAVSDSEDTPELSKLRRASRDLKAQAKTEKVAKKVAPREPMSRRSMGLVEEKKTPIMKKDAKKTPVGKKEIEKKEKARVKKEEKSTPKVKEKEEDDDSDEHKSLAKMRRRSQADESSEEEEQEGRGKNNRGKKSKEEEQKPKGRWSNARKSQKEVTSDEEDESEDDEKKVTRRSTGKIGGSKDLRRGPRKSNLRSDEYSSDDDNEILDKLRTRSKRSTHSQSSSEDEDEVERKNLRRSGRPARQMKNVPRNEDSDESETKSKPKRRSTKLASSDVETADESEKPKPRGRRSTKAVSSDVESADESEKKPRGRRPAKTLSSDDSDMKTTATRTAVRKAKKGSLSDEEQGKKPKSKKAQESDGKKEKEDIKLAKSIDSLNESADSRPTSPTRKKLVSRSQSTEKKDTKIEDGKKKKRNEEKKLEVKEKAQKGKKKKKCDDECVAEPVKSKLRKLTPRNHRVSDSGDSDDSVFSTPQRVLRERKNYFHFEEDEFSDLDDDLLEELKSPPPTRKEIADAKTEKPAKEAETKKVEPAKEPETKNAEPAEVAKKVKSAKETDSDKKKTATKEPAAKTQTKEIAKADKKKEPAAKEGEKKIEKKKAVTKEKKATEKQLKSAKKSGKKIKSADTKSNEELATAFEKITLSKEEDTSEKKAVVNVLSLTSFLKVPKPDVVEPIQVSTKTEVVKDDLFCPLSTLAMAATSSLLNEKEEEEAKLHIENACAVSSEPVSAAITSASMLVPAPSPIAVPTKALPPPLTPYIPVNVPITTEETAMVTSRTVTSLPATSVPVSGSLPVFSPVTIRMSTPTPSPMTSGSPITMNSLQSAVSLPGQMPMMLTIPTSVSTPISAVSSMLVSTSATGSSSLIIPTPPTTSTTLGGLQCPATISMSTSNQITGLAPLLTSGMMQAQGATLASMQAATSITSSQLVFIKPPDKKDGTSIHGGISDPTIAMSPVVLGMNPLLLNNRNAGPTFFLSPAGQMVSGLSIPPVLSLRLPDKTGSPQHLFTGTQLYTVPIAIGNPVVSTGMVTATNQTVMKGARTAQFVLTSKPGTVPNAPGTTSGGAPLILSVGEDGSHLLSEAPAGTHIMTQGTSTAIWKENQFVTTDSSGLLSVIPTIKSAVPPQGIAPGPSTLISQGVSTMGPGPSVPPINATLPPAIVRPSAPITQNITSDVATSDCKPVSSPAVGTVTPTLSTSMQVPVSVPTTEVLKPTMITVAPPVSTPTIVSTALPTVSTSTIATTTPVCATTTSSNTPMVSTSTKLSKKTKLDVTPSSSPTRSDTPPAKPKPKASSKPSTSFSAKTTVTVSAAAALAAVSTVSKSYTAPTTTVKSTNSLPSSRNSVVKCSSPAVTATVSSDKTPLGKSSKEDTPEATTLRAATHSTLHMLSTVLKKNDPTKEQKRELVVKKASPETSLAVKKADRKEIDLNTDKSGLDSLAEVASTLAERVCTPPTTPDKSLTPDKCGKVTPRAPEHSFWTNPAHILGRETVKMPGLPLTSNLGVATKGELAKLKIGATLSDAVEVKSKKPEPVAEKKSKVDPKPKPVKPKLEEPKTSPTVPSSNSASRVRKWLNENPPEEAEKIEESAPDDVSNLKSLADLCVSMERIADTTSKEKKPVPEIKEPPKKEQREVKAEEKPPTTPPKIPTPPTTTSSSLSMSPQTKIAWQTAFGVRSGPNKNVKKTPKKKAPGSPSMSNVLAKGPATICERWGNLKNIRIRQGGETETEQPTTVSKATETSPSRPSEASVPTTQREESQSSSSNDEISTAEKKSTSTNRRSFLHRMNERKDPTPSANAFSANNESSVYAFEADPELPPVSKPFRRRSKTSRSEEDLTRLSGEEDSSCASTSTSIAVQVNMDPVPAPARVPSPPSEPAPKIVPVKEADSRGTEISTQTEGTTTMDEEYSDSDSHTIYIPLASGPATGSSSTEGPQFQGLAVKVDTDGGPTHQRLIMKFQTQFVTKPVFKRPSTGSGSGSDEASAPKRPVLAAQHPRPSAPLEPLTTTPPIGTVPPYTTRPHSGSTGLSESPLKKGQEEDCDDEEEKDNSKILRLETIAAGEEKVFAHPEQVGRKTDAIPGKSTDDAESAGESLKADIEPEKALSESCSDSEAGKSKPPPSEPSTSMAATLESRLVASTSRDSTPPLKSKAVTAKAQAAKRRALQEPAVKEPKQRRTPKSKAFSGSQSTSCSSPPSPCPSTSSSSTIGPSRPSSVAGRRASFNIAGTVLDAPVFHPTEKEFQDPLEYFEKIRPAAEKFGLCRIVPPSTFKPDCCVSDDMRFTAYNQYIHKTLHRWGPNTKELRAIKKYLATQSIQLKQVPLVGGMEVDLPRLYATVQNMGGLAEVIEKKRWFKVADAMRIPKSAQDRVAKLDDIYCKYLLPYDTLSSAERENLFDMVELEWSTREAKLNKQTSSSSLSSDEEDDSESESGDEMEECIVKGRSTSLSAFYRIARNTMSMWFKTTEPPAAEVEVEFWKHVRDRNHHVCVHSGSIDSGNSYGFPVKNSLSAKHPWNLKVLTNNTGSVLRSLGPVMGVTVPTLHVGMLFTTCCWYKDPHSLPWIEYLHTGASKIWYGIPDSESALFREAVKDVAPQYVRDQTLWLASDTAMVPPPLLTEKEVTLSRTVQAPGQFVLVFPRSYISSICTGYLVSESVYFAPPSWLDVAHQAFKDMQDSCEPAMFSLERLMFSIAEDSRSSVDVLNQVLPVIMTVIENELSQRGALRKLGMDATERLPLDGRSKKKGIKVDLDDYECEICRASLYVSMVIMSQEEIVWCLPHALEQITDQRQIAKQCKLLYTYSQKELNELLQNLLDRIEDKTVSSKSAAKTSASKSRGNTSR